MGHAGMAATAVRYLRATGTAGTAGAALAPRVEALPRPELRCVGEDERAPVAPAEFRRVTGHFPSGVTVVTAPAAADGEGDGRPAGFACQSFSSLSLDPPLVTFMVGRTSTTWPRIARAGAFCVNVLGARQEALCRGFAVSGGDKFAHVAHDAAPVSGSPRLTGALAWLDCTIHAVHPGGDHLVVIGRVHALGTAAEDEPPLLFHKGRFI